MLFYLFLLFTLVPLVELWLLFRIAHETSFLFTVGLMSAIGVAGTARICRLLCTLKPPLASYWVRRSRARGSAARRRLAKKTRKVPYATHNVLHKLVQWAGFQSQERFQTPPLLSLG